MATEIALKDRVENGIKFLDEMVPEWPTKIDLNTLRLRSGVDCVLAQITESDFCTGRDMLGLTDADTERLGMLLEPGTYMYAELDDIWHDAIRSRQTA